MSRSRSQGRAIGRAMGSGLAFALVLTLAAPSEAHGQVAPAVQQSANDIQQLINTTFEKYKNLREGKNADYVRCWPKSIRRFSGSCS